MNHQRNDRINEQVRREVDRIIRDELHDPRIQGTWSITHADVTRDLSYAKIYVSVLEEQYKKPLLEALKNAAGYIRRELRQNMIIRYAPELLFFPDENIEYGIHIASLLKQVLPEEKNDGEESVSD